jgi:alpha-galactosidase
MTRLALSNAALVLAFLVSTSSLLPAEETVPLSALDLHKMKQGWGAAKIDQAVTGKPLTIGGQSFEHGVGTHAVSSLFVRLDGRPGRFSAKVGVDASQAGQPASVEFRVIADGKTLFRSGVMRAGDAAKTVDVDLTGVKTLLLFVGSAGDGINFDHANWADANFVVSGAKPVAVYPPREKAVILTPKPAAKPRINGPAVYGCRPGNAFVYRIPTTGRRPMAFTADNLPAGLQLDADTGIIAGVNPPRGEYLVTLRAENELGKAEKRFKIVSGDRLSLTPSMGWNTWYAYYDHVSDKLLRDAADTMVRNGMADAGYQFVSVDDCWANTKDNPDPKRVGPFRDAQGHIVPNKYFPDMKALTGYIHSRGLKAGIYTSPGPLTCAGYAGSWKHEAEDARQFADWGFDLVKYDWCSYDGVVQGKHDPETLKRPYILMGRLLKEQRRDVLYNLCQYGMGDVWTWGAEVDGQSWRTSGDLGCELTRFFEVAVQNAGHRAYSKPGCWNDPDYLIIGNIGQGGGNVAPCPLSPNEQYSYMSLWCMMAAPLFYSGDLNTLDAFTLNVLCNPEVIEVDQDPLGQSARTVALADDAVLFVKDMQDGSKAVALCNPGEMEIPVTANWSDLGLTGKQRVRDLWRQSDLGAFDQAFSAKVGRHGTLLIRLWPASRN